MNSLYPQITQIKKRKKHHYSRSTKQHELKTRKLAANQQQIFRHSNNHPATNFAIDTRAAPEVESRPQFFAVF
jgi:hypothetical protein